MMDVVELVGTSQEQCLFEAAQQRLLIPRPLRIECRRFSVNAVQSTPLNRIAYNIISHLVESSILAATESFPNYAVSKCAA